MKKLKRCPFCGGKAELKYKTVLMNPAVNVQCMNCHASTRIEIVGYTVAFKDIPSRYISIEKCGKRSIENWNRRTEKQRGIMGVT